LSIYDLTPQKIFALRKKIEQKSLSKKYLDFLYSSKIIGREKQAEQLLECLCNSNGFTMPLLSVYGRSGIGKSTVVKLVSENISDIACTGFVNLRRQKTIFGCANAILEELGNESLKNSEGLNKAMDIMKKRIIEILQLQKKNLLVLVLDEFDVVFNDSRGKPSDFVYKLLVLVENLREKGMYLCFVTISNDSIYDYSLDDRVTSRTGESEIYFPPYSKDELLEILQDRAGNLKTDSSVLEECARICSQEHGDCRRALQLLCKADSLSNGSCITKDNLHKASKALEVDKTNLAITHATVHQKLALLSLAELSLYEKTSTTSAIHVKYCSLHTDVTKLTYRRMHDVLVELCRMRVIERNARSNGRYGYAAEYSLLIDPEIVGWLVDFKWWCGMLEEKSRLEKAVKKKQKELGLD
jgi:archaeal cell division control protein 6